MWSFLGEVWQWAVAGFAILLSVVASGHTVLYKRDSRAAISWVGFIWLVPLVGAVLYFTFGVNRVKRQAIILRGGLDRYHARPPESECHLEAHLGKARHLVALARTINEVVGRPLVSGNRIDPLVNGDEAYPAMLEAIATAKRTVSLQTYIFDRDTIGLEFARALGEATRRGVEVRVLIDAAGTRYSWPSILYALRREKVNHARFLPLLGPGRLLAMNLRSHRKILVTDGLVGFTGGMNIRAGHSLHANPRSPIQDLHFRVHGPVVTQMQEAFADDWMFTTRESLRGDAWFPPTETAGAVCARGISDGPDEDFEKLRWTVLAAISIAQDSIRIVTPYFLPDNAIMSALNLAARRGVAVDILLPARNNLPFIQWASRAMWWQLLEHRCRIWLTPPPFDHTKLMLVDGCWVLLGSANWDARSLRLNFEFNLECYNVELALRLQRWVDARRESAHQVSLAEVDARPLPSRLRDGIARLAAPYL